MESPLHQPAAGPPPRAGEELPLADPERALAVAYAPAEARRALAALFALDERLGGIVRETTEPMIGLMRLAWWREALERLDAGAAPAEPLLREIAGALLPGTTGAALAEIEDGWAALLDGEPDAAAIARHGRARGGAVFEAAAAVLDSSRHAGLVPASTPPRAGCAEEWTPGQARGDAGNWGAGWALADLAYHHSSPGVRGEARRQAAAALACLPRRWPVPLRPLGALAVLARGDAAAEMRRQGAPGRVLRMLALRATGL